MPSQNRMDNLSLSSDTTAMDNPDFAVSFALRQIDILLNKHSHRSRQEAVQIYCILNRYFCRIQFPVPDLE